MSDDGWSSTSGSGSGDPPGWASAGAPPPPPPPSGAPPPPPPGYGPPPGPVGYGPPPGPADYPPMPGVAPLGPRPRVPIGGWLMTLGGVLAIVAAFLPWVSGGGETVTGMDDWIQQNSDELVRFEAPGTLFIVGGVILAGFGIALVAAGRVLAVAILGIVFAAIGLLVCIGVLAVVNDGQAWGPGAEHNLGVGPPLAVVGTLAVLAGSIVATATRRR